LSKPPPIQASISSRPSKEYLSSPTATTTGFLKTQGNTTLADFGMLAVLDFFNVKVGGTPFRSMCTMLAIQEPLDSIQDTCPS
jgi:hypothetical protein